jgi:hypothetical protein
MRLALAIFLAVAGIARAQTSLDELEKDLDQVKQEHEDATNQTVANFLAALQNAAADPNSALQLYQQAGGAMPDPTRVKSRYSYETPSEKAARLAQDQANLSALGNMAQLHCGLMRFAALFLQDPPPPTLQSDWTNWLKTAAQIYPQINGGDDLRKMPMKDSPISAYLNFHGWGDKEQGTWTVHHLPTLYRQYVLDPLRNPLVADALPAWDAYINLRGANEADTPDLWSSEDQPELQFERTCDDYALSPNTYKLQALVELIKAHPTHPKIDEWIAKVHDLLQGYKTSHPGSSDSAATPPTTTNAATATPPTTNSTTGTTPTTNSTTGTTPPTTNAPAQ